MRCLLPLLLATTAAIAAEDGPRVPDLTQAIVQPADVPGLLVVSDPRQVRGYDALLLPVARLLYIEDRLAPKGTRTERSVTLVFETGGAQPLRLTFDDGTAAKPAEVLAALAAVRR